MIEAKLIEARRLIKQSWIKEDLEDGLGGVCSLGALNKAFTGSATTFSNDLVDPCREANELVREAMLEVVPFSKLLNWIYKKVDGGSVLGIEDMNDWHTTRKRHILRAFDKAIKVAHERELCGPDLPEQPSPVSADPTPSMEKAETVVFDVMRPSQPKRDTVELAHV